jgi:hypothetical protein
MRFLRSKVSAAALASALFPLALNCSSLFASPISNATSSNGDEVDLAKAQTGADIVFISSGMRAAVLRAIDDDRRTVFQFAESDPHPTLVVRLFGNNPIHRVSVVAGSETEKVDVYLLGQIPRDASELNKINPIGSIVDLAVAKESALEFAPQIAHYVALRWTFSKNPPQRAIALAELSAFGQGGVDANAITLAAADPPPPDPVQDPPVIHTVSP